MLDNGTSHAHHLTPDCTCCEGFYQNFYYSFRRLFIVTEYKFTITVTQFASFHLSWGSSCSIYYKLVILVLYFHARITCTHSNASGCSDMTEPLDKYAPGFEITCMRRYIIKQNWMLNLQTWLQRVIVKPSILQFVWNDKKVFMLKQDCHIKCAQYVVK